MDVVLLDPGIRFVSSGVVNGRSKGIRGAGVARTGKTGWNMEYGILGMLGSAGLLRARKSRLV